MHPQPCGLSLLPPPSLASLKLFAKICPVEQPKLTTVQAQGTEQFKGVRLTVLISSTAKILRTHTYFKNSYRSSAKEENGLMKSKWTPEARNKWTDWRKYYFFFIWFNAMIPSDSVSCVFHFWIVFCLNIVITENRKPSLNTWALVTGRLFWRWWISTPEPAFKNHLQCAQHCWE